MAIRHSITLSTTEPNNEIGVIKIRQADEQTQTLEVQITENGVPKSYQGLAVYFCAKLGQTAGLGIIEQKLKLEEMTNPANGKLEYTMRAEDWQILGRQKGYFSFRKMKDEHEFIEQFTTRDFTFEVIKSVYSDGLKEVKKDGSTYVWTIEDLIRLFNEYMASGKSDWEEFVEQNREVLESVDPGGKLIGELIDARRPFGGEVYATLGERLDSEKAEVSAQLAQNANQIKGKTTPYFAMKRKLKTDASYSFYNVNIIGDSISQGYDSTDQMKLCWGSLMRRFVNKEFDSTNIGFVSLMNTHYYQTLTEIGTWSNAMDYGYLGTHVYKSIDATAKLTIVPKFKQKYFSVCYEQLPDGGYFDVYVNNVLAGTVNTAGTTDKSKKSAQFAIPFVGTPTIELRKKDSLHTNIAGLWYYDNPSKAIVNNYGRSSAKLTDMQNSILDKMLDANIVFFALGHNDSDASVFADKIDYVKSKLISNKAFLIVLDFRWSKDATDPIRKQLKRLADEVDKAIYIAPNDYLFENDLTVLMNQGFFLDDYSHPSDFGHKIIAESTAKILGLSVSSKSLVETLESQDGSEWHYVGTAGEPAFENGWANSFTNSTKYRKIGDVVYVEFYIIGGTVDQSVFKLPTGFRPNLTYRQTFNVFDEDGVIRYQKIEVDMGGAVILKTNQVALGHFYGITSFAI